MKKRILHSGKWVVLGEGGLFAAGDTLEWRNKKSAVSAIFAHLDDPGKVPMVRKMSAGEYVYFPKNKVTGRYESDTYRILRLTKALAKEHALNWKDQTDQAE